MWSFKFNVFVELVLFTSFSFKLVEIPVLSTGSAAAPRDKSYVMRVWENRHSTEQC